MNLKKNHKIFDLVDVFRDTYMQKYDALLNEKNEKIAYAKKNFIKGSDGYKNALDMANSEFDVNVEVLQKECLAEIKPEIESKKMEIRAEVSTVDTNTMQQLNAIAQLPISNTEMQLVCDRYQGKNYWIDRKLSQIADNNGCRIALEPSLDVKMSVLDDLERRIDSFIADYEGRESQTLINFDMLSSNKLLHLEKMYTNDYLNSRLSARERAKRIISNAKTKGNILDISVTLNQAYKNADYQVQEAILFELATNEKALTPEQMKHSGMAEMVDVYKESGFKSMKLAFDGFNELKVATSKDAIKDVIVKYGDNKKFIDLASELALDNFDVYNALQENTTTYDKPKDEQTTDAGESNAEV